MKPCIACGGNLFDKPLLTLSDMPASAQDIPALEQLDNDSGITLNLCQCHVCGLVQFDCEPVWYYREVIRSGGFSTTMVELRRRQYRHLISKYHLEGKRFIEIGCGQGEFLSVLTEFPAQAYGIEYRAKLAGQARALGLCVWQDFAGASGDRLNGPDNQGAVPPYDVFLSFNFLEHQPDPSGMLAAIYENLAEDGMGLITVPSLEYILEHDGYYELIRDHLAYYTFGSLTGLLERSGFQVLEQELVNRDTLAVIVRKIVKLNPSVLGHSQEKHPQGINHKGSITFWPLDITRLADSRMWIAREVDKLMGNLSKSNKAMAIWGASHQGFTLAATTSLGQQARYIIDSAPFKQGLYAPASHLPIVAPEHFASDPVDAILIVAPGYTEEIAAIIRQWRKVPERQIQILTLRSNHLEMLAD